MGSNVEWPSLVQVCAENPSCREFMSTVALSRPNDILLYISPPSGSSILSTPFHVFLSALKRVIQMFHLGQSILPFPYSQYLCTNHCLLQQKASLMKAGHSSNLKCQTRGWGQRMGGKQFFVSLYQIRALIQKKSFCIKHEDLLKIKSFYLLCV